MHNTLKYRYNKKPSEKNAQNYRIHVNFVLLSLVMILSPFFFKQNTYGFWKCNDVFTNKLLSKKSSHMLIFIPTSYQTWKKCTNNNDSHTLKISFSSFCCKVEIERRSSSQWQQKASNAWNSYWEFRKGSEIFLSHVNNSVLASTWYFFVYEWRIKEGKKENQMWQINHMLWTSKCSTWARKKLKKEVKIARLKIVFSHVNWKLSRFSLQMCCNNHSNIFSLIECSKQINSFVSWNKAYDFILHRLQLQFCFLYSIDCDCVNNLLSSINLNKNNIKKLILWENEPILLGKCKIQINILFVFFVYRLICKIIQSFLIKMYFAYKFLSRNRSKKTKQTIYILY